MHSKISSSLYFPNVTFRQTRSFFKGEFRGGRIWGNGLLTFSDGVTGAEGYFQDSRFSRDGNAAQDIKKAKKVLSTYDQIVMIYQS